MRSFYGYAAGASGAALALYLVRLMLRTSLFERTAAVGADTLLIVGVTSTCALLLSALFFRNTSGSGIARVVLWVNIGLVACYTILFLLGKFGPVGPKMT